MKLASVENFLVCELQYNAIQCIVLVPDTKKIRFLTPGVHWKVIQFKQINISQVSDWFNYVWPFSENQAFKG